MRRFISIALAAGVLAACSGGAQQAQQSQTPAPAVRRTMLPMSNGNAIFHSGRDLSGVQMTAAKPPLRQSCAACHGANGAGGVHLPGGAVSADLRYHALVTAQHPPYTVALLQRAISQGLDNQGKPLNPVMPRWHMSPRDLHDVAVYVLSLK